MTIYHVYYFSTLLGALALPAYYLKKDRNPASCGVLFTTLYCYYSFLGPLVFLVPRLVDRHVTVHLYAFHLLGGQGNLRLVAYSHTLYLLFYASWAAAYFFSRRKSDRSRGLCLEKPPKDAADLAIISVAATLLASIWFASQEMGLRSLLTLSSGYTRSFRHASLATMSTRYLLAFTLACASSVCLQLVSMKRPQLRTLWWSSAAVVMWLGIATGDRSQLLFFVIAVWVCHVYFGSWGKKLDRVILRSTVVGVSVVVFLFSFVGRMRNYSVDQYGDVLFTDHGWQPKHLIVDACLSSESVIPYASLPVIVSSIDDLWYGRSFLNLATGFLPRQIAPWRPSTTFFYEHYMGLTRVDTEFMGYASHIAAEWYLNFGLLGMLIGGTLTGAAFGWLENVASRRRSIFWQAILVLTVAYIPNFLRSGMEGLRMMAFFVGAIPFLCFVIPARKEWSTRSVWWRKSVPARW